MTRPACYDGIAEIVQQAGGTTRRAQVVTCACPGCTEKIEMPVKEERKPPGVVFNIARRKGWNVNEGKRVFLCPSHGRKH